MKFTEIIEQTTVLLQQKRRVAYRTLQREFGLDEEALEDLKLELIDVQEVAVDKDGKMLVWSGDRADPPAPSPQARPSASPPVQLAVPEGDRRQLTVMFCDLVGSTALSEQLDPEDLHAVVRTYQAACRKVIERYDGYIAQYLGDGILVYFGYPAAHEDDAIRGVRAGLEILAALPTLELAQPIQARIGIHTGPVVIGAVGGGDHTEQLALGETPNIAARVQGKAAPNTVAISADTYHLVQGFFACIDLGPQDLKGLSTPVRLYNVTGEGAAQTRFDVSVQQGLTPLIGREEEVELLLRRWERATAGNGQVVLLSGEAGIGKSRLMQVLRDHTRNEPHLSILCRCSPFYQNSALYPIIDRMQQVWHFNKDDSADAKLTKLTQSLEPVDMTDAESMALFAGLLSIPLPDNHPPLQYSPQKQKEKTLQALVTWLHKTAVQRAVRLEVEDLHWADPSTLELLGLLIDQAPASRMLLLLTFRPEFAPPWPAQAHTLQMYLNRLPQQEIAAMMEQVAGKGLPDEVVQQLLIKSDGVPLYIEEMTKNLLESGLLNEADGHYELAGPLPEMAIPSSLQDSFAARLDRLAPVRELAQIGAVLGREFSYELIQAVSQMQDPKLQDGLGQLSAAEILFQRGVPPAATYTFKHALLQDAAYASLLKSQRQQFHAQTATVLEQQFPETQETHPELLAHHYTEAALSEQAIGYWQQAGQRAAQRSANAEAVNHLRRGLALVKTLAETPECVQHELALTAILGPVLIQIQGWAAAETSVVYTRAAELCEQLGESVRRFPVLYGLWGFHVARGGRQDYQAARKLAEQLLHLAEREQDTALLVEAHFTLGLVLFYLGEITAARRHLDQAVAQYDAQQHAALAFTYGHDPATSSLVFGGWALWCLGYPEQALRQSQAGVTLAEGLTHPFSLAFARGIVSTVAQHCQGWDTIQERVEAVITVATDQGFPFFVAFGTVLRGWTFAGQGQAAAGIAEMQQGIAAMRETGSDSFLSYHLGLLADGHRIAGQTEDGLATIAEALAFVHQNDEGFYEAELYRLKGELTLKKFKARPEQSRGVQGSQFKGEDEAEACFHKALDIAREQQAKSWELRAATSLAQLWQSQGKTVEARELLAPVYEWFTEGFDTADLKDAKMLLDALLVDRAKNRYNPHR